MSAKPKEAACLQTRVAASPLGAELLATEHHPVGHSQSRVARRDWAPEEEGPLTLAEVYETQFDFVWRCARRLGVAQLHLDDVVQEVFLVVHRRLSELRERAALKTWLFAITRRVVRDYRRSARRKPSEPFGTYEPATAPSSAADAVLAQAEDARLLYTLLDELDDEKREVFVLAELEQLNGPEIAALLRENVNTVYARLRAARCAFEAAVTRHNARSRRCP